jgi:hypothetical protein
MISSTTTVTILSYGEITGYASLQQSIRHLKEQKLEQEAILSVHFADLIHSMNPVEIAKGSLHDLVSDKEVQYDLVKLGLNLSAEFITARLFSRIRSVPAFLGVKMVEKIAAFFLNDKFSKSNETSLIMESENTNEKRKRR